MTNSKKTRTKGVSQKRDPKNRAEREKSALLKQLAQFGLLDQDVVERLEKKIEGLREAKSDALAQAASWDRSLINGLNAFAASGDDKELAKTFHGLVTWQATVAGSPATRDGITEAVAALGKVIPMDGATLLLRDPDREKMRRLAVVGTEVELIGRIRFSEGMGFSCWVAGRKQPVLYSSLHRNESPGSKPIRSFMCVPLVVGEECVGVLNVGHQKDGAFTPASLRALTVAGAVLAGLVQRYVARRQISAREIADPRTGLATSGYLDARLQEEVVRCRELGHSMSFLMINLNELDEHSRRFGGDYRDRCRLELADLVKVWRRPTELVGYAKDDRLAVIMPSTRRDQAQARAEELALALSRHIFPRRKRMTVGMGLASYPADAEAAQELVDYADKVLCEAVEIHTSGGGALPTLALS